MAKKARPARAQLRCDARKTANPNPNPNPDAHRKPNPDPAPTLSLGLTLPVVRTEPALTIARTEARPPNLDLVRRVPDHRRTC